MTAAVLGQPLSMMGGPSNDFPSASVPEHLPEAQQIENGQGLLDRKICEPLTQMGYNIQNISRVSGLVKQNAITAELPESWSSTDDIGTVIQNELFESRNLKVNSNEPVLLIEVLSQSSAGDVWNLRESLLDVLRARGIKPVRLYVQASEDVLVESVTLLNVVNTELGGPSMVQLLDAAFHDASWKNTLVVKEAWNGYDLLWRDEAWPSESSMTGAAAVERSIKPEGETAVQPLTSDSELEESTPVVEQPELPSLHREGSLQESDEEEPLVVEHPAMKELREKEAGRAQVQHPTFSRDEDDHSLLDIIRTHSGAAKDEGPASVIGKAGKGSDDGFEMI